MRLAFHSNQLGMRGTEVALYDYALYNEEILGNESFILAKHPNIWNYSNPNVIEKFTKRFRVYFYEDFNSVEKFLEDNNIDVFYAIKAGNNDGIVSKNKKSINHVVFQYYEPHGNIYAYVSEWLGKRFNSPYVPHMVNLPNINENLRNELSIPNNAIVFGRHGGFGTFDVHFVKDTVRKIAQNRKDIYFLFLGTNKFSESSESNIIYLQESFDLEYKVKFINTCNAMIHGRKQGESFGLAVAEFSIRNKPVITKLNDNIDSAHIEMLGRKGIYYTNEHELTYILNNFIPDESIDWNAYKEYNPLNVMNIFKQVFLDN